MCIGNLHLKTHINSIFLQNLIRGQRTIILCYNILCTNEAKPTDLNYNDRSTSRSYTIV